MPKIISTTNEEPAYGDLKHPSNKSKQTIGNLKKGTEHPSPRKDSIYVVEEGHHKIYNNKNKKGMFSCISTKQSRIDYGRNDWLLI